MLIFVEIQDTLAPLVVKIETNEYILKQKFFKPICKWLHSHKCWANLFSVYDGFNEIQAGGLTSTSSCFILFLL